MIKHQPVRSHKTEHKEEPAPAPAAKPDDEKECQVIRDLSAAGARILIRCEGVPDIVLLEIGEIAPGVPILHAEGSSNIRVR